ncbi:hypothetical protein [Hydrogenophaga laconesensis]|uniref:Uncharacterized protein n=1 Tax=Hydrogenophaga laconesensis TaxID=1805971 RepID=A0ABU1VBB9_9BURK|nr:hypothetical protein [Hydrogenophaga laconesensis]MDR7094771.1 hypothetical protein [Hydrogenophaga laconesensis]
MARVFGTHAVCPSIATALDLLFTAWGGSSPDELSDARAVVTTPFGHRGSGVLS